MKKLLLFALLVLSAIYAPAQSKLNPAARIMVNDMKMFPSRVGGTERVSALVRLAEGADVSVLSVDGVKLISSLAGMRQCLSLLNLRRQLPLFLRLSR